MDRIKRKKPEFRRIAAMIMAAAMIISVIPFPEGLFHVTAAAAVKMSATCCQFNINRFRRCRGGKCKRWKTYQ